MSRTIPVAVTATLAIGLAFGLAAPATAQSTIAVEDAPFKEAGSLSSRVTDASGGRYTDITAQAAGEDRLRGARVIDAAGTAMGDVASVLMAEDEIVGLIIQVGGFLGLSEKPVLIPLPSAEIGEAEDGELRVLIDMTESELAEMESYVPAEG